jgi:hypothetical protein
MVVAVLSLLTSPCSLPADQFEVEELETLLSKLNELLSRSKKARLVWAGVVGSQFPTFSATRCVCVCVCLHVGVCAHVSLPQVVVCL